ncbi:hypothetical protein L7F22_001156 [Adiantum nelumboides]|nr:hypothetical protein [Adiantum nelumboides]
MASSRVQDAARMLAGIALVAREAALTSNALAHLRLGDFPGFAWLAVARAVNSVSDIAGLSRGSPVSFRSSEETKRPSGASSVDPRLSHTDAHQPSILQHDDTAALSRHDPFSRSPSSSLQVEAPPSLPNESSDTISDVSANNAADLKLSPSLRSLENAPDFALQNQVSTSDSSIAGGSSLRRRKPRERRVPSTPFGRAFGYRDSVLFLLCIYD